MNESVYIEPKVSVIMPVLNGEKYIIEALISVFNQTYENMEILVCNDGSTDSTREIVEEFKCKHDTTDKIKIIDKKNTVGIAKNLNTGIEAAIGKYISILDHDDKLIDQDKTTRQVSFLEKNRDYGIVGTNTLIDIQGKIIKNCYPKDDTDIRQVILGKCPMLHSSTMYHRSLALDIGGYNGNYKCAVDYDLFLRMLKESKGYNLEENMTYYRIHKKNISTLKSTEQKRNALKLTRENRNNFPNTTKALVYRIGSLLLSTLLPNTDEYKKLQLLIKNNY